MSSWSTWVVLTLRDIGCCGLLVSDLQTMFLTWSVCVFVHARVRTHMCCACHLHHSNRNNQVNHPSLEGMLLVCRYLLDQQFVVLSRLSIPVLNHEEHLVAQGFYREPWGIRICIIHCVHECNWSHDTVYLGVGLLSSIIPLNDLSIASLTWPSFQPVNKSTRWTTAPISWSSCLRRPRGMLPSVESTTYLPTFLETVPGLAIFNHIHDNYRLIN